MNKGLIVILALVALGVGFGLGFLVEEAVKPSGVPLDKYSALVKEREDWMMQAAISKKQADLKVSELQQRLAELEQKLTRSERERNELQQRLGRLKTAEIDAAMMQQLKDFFGTSQPFDAPLPEHLYKVLDDGTAIFLHFDKPLAEGPTKILYIGDAVPGKFCNTPEVQGLIEQGYVHFHTTSKVATPEEGQGGKGGVVGFWLRHIAVGELDMPWGHVTPGIYYNFMVTQPPDCP